MRNDYAIFVSSADSYSDLWPAFFTLVERMWPGYGGRIYLNTQEKTFSHPGLDIVCTQVGQLGAFGATLKAGLRQVEEENVLFLMVDYLLMGPVDEKRLAEHFEHFRSQGLDGLILACQFWVNEKESRHPDFVAFAPPAVHRLFSFQAGFWKKDVLLALTVDHENPWMGEWFGDLRAVKMGLIIESLRREAVKPIPYDGRGCLHQGYWLQNAREWLDEQGIAVDYSRRGLYEEHEVYKTHRFRFKVKWMIWQTGLKGSYWDLLRRKPLHASAQK